MTKRVIMTDCLIGGGKLQAGDTIDDQVDPERFAQLLAIGVPMLEFTAAMQPVIDGFRNQRDVIGRGGEPDLYDAFGAVGLLPPGAPPTFAEVAAALGGEAGTNVGWIFRSDGAGSGTMAPNQDEIARRLTVGLPGSDVDHNSVAAAVAAAVTGGASAATPWIVTVYPGTYGEDPFTLPPGVVLTTPDGERDTLVRLVANNPLADFITCTGGDLRGVFLAGVTDPAAALVRFALPVATTFANLTLGACSNGIVVSGGATLVISDLLVTVIAPASAINLAVQVTGAGTLAIMRHLLCNIPAAILPAYPGSNPLETLLLCDGGGRCQVTTGSVRIAHNTATQRGFVVDESSELLLQAVFIEDCEVGVQVGTVGASLFRALSGDFNNNTINIQSLSSLAIVEAVIATDAPKLSLVAGTQFGGQILDRTTEQTLVYRLGINFGQPDFEVIDAADYLANIISSAFFTGSMLSDGGGLDVDVAAGSGVVRLGGGVAGRTVSWAADTITLPASSTRFLLYQSSTDSVIASAGPPGPEDILFGVVVTGAAAIRYIHTTGPSTADIAAQVANYLYDTRRVTVVSGLTAQVGSGATKITVNAGTYYLGLNRIPLLLQADSVFSAYFGPDGATEQAAQTDVNTTDYDNAGVLTAMQAGFFRSDTLYRTSDGKLSLIFGDAEYAVQGDAEAQQAAGTITAIEASAFATASIIVEQGVGIVEIVDRRPFANAAAGGASGGTTATAHGSLTGLGNDDHTQYLLGDGTRPMSGNLDMGANAINNVGNVDGVDVSAHAARHAPGAADALTTATAGALQVGASAGEGVAASFARSDHIHGVTRGTPTDIGAANAPGTSSSFVGSDHVHAHGSQAGGTTHALAVAGGAAGFISGSDQDKLDNIEPNATDSPLSNTAPVDVTKSAAAAGAASEAARQDHKHDVSTAAAGAIAIGDTAAEGSATSLARSDHTHGLAAPGSPANVTKAAAAPGASSAPARADHKHDIDTGTPVAVGSANAEGGATSLARSDHTHAPKSGSVIQNVFLDQAADLPPNASTTFVTLFSQNVTVLANSSLQVMLTASGITGANNTEVSFRVTIDGNVLRATSGNWRSSDASCAALVARSPALAAGSRTVLIEWKVNGSTATIAPTTNPGEDHASAIIQEIAA